MRPIINLRPALLLIALLAAPPLIGCMPGGGSGGDGDGGVPGAVEGEFGGGECARPVGWYRPTLTAAHSSDPGVNCSLSNGPFFIGDTWEAIEVDPGDGRTCNGPPTAYQDDDCRRVAASRCNDGGEAEIDCTADGAGADRLDCVSTSSYPGVTCTIEFTLDRIECPDWALTDDGACRQCANDAVCPADYQCRGGNCVLPCVDDADCADAGTRCESSFGLCLIPPPG